MPFSTIRERLTVISAEDRPYSRDRSRSPANGNGDYKDTRERSASPDRRDRDRGRDQDTRESRYAQLMRAHNLLRHYRKRHQPVLLSGQKWTVQG